MTIIVNGKIHNGNINSIDPKTIQSINIIKDADEELAKKYNINVGTNVINVSLK
ncbi:MAG: hypothetical protein R3Y26_09965 [Rikenellaceae bacterium]